MLNKKLFRLEKKKKSFISKLYDILNNTTYKDIIYWNKEGKYIIIADVNKFRTIVLPLYYNHSNYSSFVRQLNTYGFHKSKGVIKEGEAYEHEKLNKNSILEDIKQIIKIKKRKNLLIKYLKKDSKDNFNNSFEHNDYDNEENIFNFLLKQNENSIKIINESKKEIEILEKQNRNFYDELKFYKNGHNIILKNIIKNIHFNKIKDKKNQKSRNLGELFRKYLYHLKIYSPFLIFENDNNLKLKLEKVETLNFNCKLGNELSANLNYYNTNMNSMFNDSIFTLPRQDTNSFDFFEK